MPELQAVYSVVLRTDLPLLERELFRQYCHEIHGADGNTLLQLRCRTLTAEHAVYLELDVILPRRRESRHIRLPHACVLLIEGDGAQPLPGPTDTPALPDH